MTSPLRRKHRTTASARRTATPTEARDRRAADGRQGASGRWPLAGIACLAVVLCCQTSRAANIDGGRLRSSLRWLSPKSAAAKKQSVGGRMSSQRSADRWSKAAEPTGVLDTNHAAPGGRMAAGDGGGWQPLKHRVPRSSGRNGEIRLTAGAVDDPFSAGGEEASEPSLDGSPPDRFAFQGASGDETAPLPPEIGFSGEQGGDGSAGDQTLTDGRFADAGPAGEDVVGPHFAVADDGGDSPAYEAETNSDSSKGFDNVPLLAQRPGERSAFDRSGDPPPAEDGRYELPEIGGGFRARESEPERCPSPKDLKPISQITHRIAAEPGLFPQECALSEEPFKPRNFQITTFTWKASALCHKPLYFQQPKLERYGHTFGPVLTPALSAGHFFISVIALPYKMGMNPPWECVYPLGWYRPGSCAPYTLGPVPISLRGAATQGIVTTGLWFLFP